VTTGAPAGRYGLARPVGWFATAAAAASCLYLLTPKSPFARWEFASTRIEVGYAADQMIDLTRTGNLEENNEVAFEVEAAEADGRPKTDLNPNQLWRGTVMIQYAHGRWQRDAQPVFPRVADPPRLVTPWTPPDLGRGEYRLTFAVPTRLRSQFLSAPVAWDPGEPPPVADITPDGRFVPWYTLNDGSFLRLPGFAVGGPVTRYVQYTRPAAEPGLGPGFALAGEAKPVLVHNPVPGVKAYASQLLDRLIREGQLPAAASTPDPVRLHLAPEYHEPVARAFARHLSESPEFTYTTTLRRERKSLDPVEEFLIHTRAGHCERFATALVLMLRSQGIPAVLVLGFRGCEPVDGGRYEVRQEHAHAWTNVLISRPGPGASRVWHWLSLDATPNRSAETGLPAAHDGTWWGRAAAAVREYVSRNVVNATPEQRLRALGELAGHLTDGWALAGFAGVGVAVVLVRAARRTGSRPARAPASARWFDRLLTALARHGYAPRPGETPREFAARVAVDLRSSPATVELADVPLEWADAYYRARFGGATVPDERRAELETRLDALRRALAG
jgi:transglutaminase-like putative cysteine protease